MVFSYTQIFVKRPGFMTKWGYGKVYTRFIIKKRKPFQASFFMLLNIFLFISPKQPPSGLFMNYFVLKIYFGAQKGANCIY